jgi:hypothetical protein
MEERYARKEDAASILFGITIRRRALRPVYWLRVRVGRQRWAVSFLLSRPPCSQSFKFPYTRIKPPRIRDLEERRRDRGAREMLRERCYDSRVSIAQMEVRGAEDLQMRTMMVLYAQMRRSVAEVCDVARASVVWDDMVEYKTTAVENSVAGLTVFEMTYVFPQTSWLLPARIYCAMLPVYRK